MRKLIATAVLSQALIIPTAMADFLGIYVGAGSWSHEASNSFSSTDTGSSSIDMEADLGFSDESETYVWAAFDHPIPVIPNIRLEKTALTHTGTATASLSFNGATTNINDSSTVTLDSTDVILYYRLLDNWVNFDLGLNFRKVDGEFTIGNESLSISETVPMLYVAAQFDLPFTGFSVGADYNIVSYDGNSYDDIRIRAIYEMGVIGFEAGLRTTTIELDDVDNINADLEFKGLMLGAFLHF